MTVSTLRVCFLDRINRGEEVGAFLVRFEHGIGGAVIPKGAEYLMETGVAAFGEVELLEEFTHATIPISSAYCAEGS